MHKGKILIADDDEFIRFTLDTIFKDDGYITTTTKDGKKAKELIVQEKFDVVITDIKMPEVDGVELLKWIKEAYPQISVIMITGYASLDSSIDSLRAGADDYIVKPFDVDYLKIQVQGCINKKTLGIEGISQLLGKQASKNNFADEFSSLLNNTYDILINKIQTSLKDLLDEEKDLNKYEIRSALTGLLNTINESKEKFLSLNPSHNPNFDEGNILKTTENAKGNSDNESKKRTKINKKSPRR